MIARGREGGVSRYDDASPPEEERGAGGSCTLLWCRSQQRRRRGRGAEVFVIFVNVSMGRHLPRLMGYRSRLGMVLIPIVGGGSTAVVDKISNEEGSPTVVEHFQWHLPN